QPRSLNPVATGAADLSPSFSHCTAPPHHYTLSLHDALPILTKGKASGVITSLGLTIDADAVILTNGTFLNGTIHIGEKRFGGGRSEEHTSELQSRENLVCRLLLEKKQMPEQHDTVAPEGMID